MPLTILEETSGFILTSQLHWVGGNIDMAVVKDAKAKHPMLASCSFDRGYHSPDNQKKLAKELQQVTLPAKGRGTIASRAREASPEFKAAKKKHPGVESAIHRLECHGLARVRVRGKERFERTVELSILATNLHRLGRLLQKRDRVTARRRRKPLPLAA